MNIVFCECEVLSVSLWVEHGFILLEIWVLKRIFRPKREEVKRVWRKLHTEEH
jgi:hypothetical protein